MDEELRELPTNRKNFSQSILYLSSSKSHCFQIEPGSFVQPKHQVHVLNRLTGGPFQKIVDAGDDHQLIIVFFEV